MYVKPIPCGEKGKLCPEVHYDPEKNIFECQKWQVELAYNDGQPSKDRRCSKIG